MRREVKWLHGCSVASEVERGKAKTGWKDRGRNVILMPLLVTFIAMSKASLKVWPGEGNEYPHVCAALGIGWARYGYPKS